ncbi:transposase [Sulfitobacter sp. LCG007]
MLASSFEGVLVGLKSVSGSKTEAILSRRSLTDAQWARSEPYLLGKKGVRGRRGAGNRLFVDAVPCPARTASPWRDVPLEPGNRRTVPCRFRRGTLAGVRDSLFMAFSCDPDVEYVPADATIRKVHADAPSRKGA